jgi:hypothetical protein
MVPLRRLIAALCLVTLLVAAINPIAPSLFVALLVPLFFFLAPVSDAVPGPKPENDEAPAIPFLAVFSSRGPPQA